MWFNLLDTESPSCLHFQILIFNQSFFLPTDAQVNFHKKTILKFTLKLILKQLRRVSVQSHHHQGAQYSCLLELQLLK
jgi:hypothetical protein